MLNQNQINFLKSLSSDKLDRIVTVYPWEPRGLELANQIISDIRKADPGLEVLLMGSVALKIAGERDLDITGISPKAEQEQHAKKLMNIFGPPNSSGKSHTGWILDRENYHITFYIGDLSSPNAMEQKQIFEILMENFDLRKEYEQIKIAMSGKSYKEYQEAKYEFYNRVLGIKE